MRHNKKFNHLSRKKGHRDALLSNLDRYNNIYMMADHRSYHA